MPNSCGNISLESTATVRLQKRFSIMRLIFAIALGYVAVALVMMMFQRRMMYYPSRYSAELAQHVAAQRGFEPWRNAEGKIIGWKVTAITKALGSVLVVHGNGGAALDRGYFAEPLRAAGLDVYLLEYPGYGARDGRPSKAAFYAAGDEAMHLLPTNGPLFVVSESLGTGVAAHLAERFPERVTGLTMFVPYDKMTSLAQHHMRLFPASLILWDRYHPAKSLRDYRGPIQFVVAANDVVIPPEFGKRLHDGYAGPKRLNVVANAGHNDVCAEPASWWNEVLQWSTSASPARRSTP